MYIPDCCVSFAFRCIYVAETKALISCTVTVQLLICAFVFAYAKSRFSHYAAHICDAKTFFYVSETLKLDNGNAPDAGYFSSLSVYRFGTWGQICGEFWDHQDATVACQQLGYKGGKASFYDRGQNVPLLVGRIECQGNETRLEDCEETEQFCDTGRVAGVFCYKSQGNLSS